MDPLSLGIMGGSIALPLLFKAISEYRKYQQPMITPQGQAPSPTPTAANVLGSSVGFSPTATPTSTVVQKVIPTPSGEVTQNNAVDYTEIERKIKQGLVDYGGEDLPAIKQIPVMMNAIKSHDLFRNNPYLLPQQAILETSGGRNITRPNNLINYGIRSPQINKLFSEVGVDEALRRSAKEMGETGSVYKRFRTGAELSDTELDDYAKQFEPANPEYPRNLKEGIKYFKSK